MKAIFAIALGMCVAVPALAADIETGAIYEPRPVTIAADEVGCVGFNAFVAADSDVGIGFNAGGAACDPEILLSGLCLDDELVGHSAPVAGCSDGFLACTVHIFSDCFNDVGGTDTANLFLWNDTGTGPADACGTELLVLDSVPIQNCELTVPGTVADENFAGGAGLFASPFLTYHVGATYDVLTCFNLPGGSGTDWSISNDAAAAPGPNHYYLNLSGVPGPGNWQDVTILGIDRAAGMGYRVTPTTPTPSDCGGVVPVQPSSWGAIKHSFE